MSAPRGVALHDGMHDTCCAAERGRWGASACALCAVAHVPFNVRPVMCVTGRNPCVKLALINCSLHVCHAKGQMMLAYQVHNAMTLHCQHDQGDALLLNHCQRDAIGGKCTLFVHGMCVVSFAWAQSAGSSRKLAAAGSNCASDGWLPASLGKPWWWQQ